MTQRPGETARAAEHVPSGDISFAEVIAGVEDEVADLITRLPDDVGLIELVMAEGSDPCGLTRMLESLPDSSEVEQLTAALNNPAKLEQLLAARDNGVRAVLPRCTSS
jgi:hypothetical protein